MQGFTVRRPAAVLQSNVSMLAWTIARRFSQSLRRKGFARFTTVVAVASVALGTLAVCLSQSILAGYDEIIQDTAKRFGLHLTVQRFDASLLTNAASVTESLMSIPGVAAVDEAVRQETLVKKHSVIDGAVVIGLPAEHLHRAFSGLIDPVTLTKLSDQVIIGSGLCRRLRAGRGDTITLITKSGGDNQPMVARVSIGGVFTSGMMSYDDHAVITLADRAGALLHLPKKSASMLMITSRDGLEQETIVREIRRRYPEHLMVLTFKDHFAPMWNWIDLQKRPIPVIMSLIAIVSMFTVVSTVLLSIVEKTRSLAVLSTLGMSPWKLALVTAMRVLSTSSIGILAGLAVSVAFIVVQREYHPISLDGNIYYVQYLPVALDAWILLRSSLLIFLVACLASIVPMIITTRIRPVRALRFR